MWETMFVISLTWGVLGILLGVISHDEIPDTLWGMVLFSILLGPIFWCIIVVTFVWSVFESKRINE